MKRIYLTAPFNKTGEVYLETRVAIVAAGRITALSEPVSFPLVAGIQSVEVIPIDNYFHSKSKSEEDANILRRFALL